MNTQMCLVTLAFLASLTLSLVDAAVSPPLASPSLPVGVAPPGNANAPLAPATPLAPLEPGKGQNSDDLNADSTFGLWGLGYGLGGWGGGYGGWGSRYGGWGGSYYGWPYGGYRSYYRPYYSWGWGW
ncbi:unnamed protein product [Orchesella dallaii]|uniref:Uncharacterized protein n=1 Tax=Orchesella dallaii TaxID=48710 RepID=A0ABP1QU77_9HEXA